MKLMCVLLGLIGICIIIVFVDVMEECCVVRDVLEKRLNDDGVLA